MFMTRLLVRLRCDLLSADRRFILRVSVSNNDDAAMLSALADGDGSFSPAVAVGDSSSNASVTTVNDGGGVGSCQDGGLGLCGLASSRVE